MSYDNLKIRSGTSTTRLGFAIGCVASDPFDLGALATKTHRRSQPAQPVEQAELASVTGRETNWKMGS